MAVTGGIKFFDGIKNLYDDGATISASSGTARANYVLGRNPLALWKSDTGSDATTETLTITLPTATTITRLFLLNTNFETFDIMYDNAGWINFSSVVGINGATYGGGITETTFAYDSAYYEFASVSTTQIRIRATTTQVTDAKKYLGQLILSTELGTLTGYPGIKPMIERNKRTQKNVSGRMDITRGLDIFSATISFANYPTAAAFQSDVSLAFQLNDRDTPFLVWPCGGRTGSTYFKHTIPGFRLKDVALVNVVNELDSEYQRNIYVNGVDFDLKLEEAA